MDWKRRLASCWFRRRPKTLSATRIIALTFAAIILTGACLLSLPAASRSGVSCGFRPALFTATSATCVTGLVLYDTWSQWSGFGQVVIISLIQIGGLGFMSAATLFVFLLRRRIGLKQRLVMAQALSLNEIEGVVRLQKTVLIGSFAVEAVGAGILTVHFWPEHGFATALRWGAFHAVSAFCNAGFDIFGSITPGASLLELQSDPVVLLTLCCLIVIGGLGFLVWQEVQQKRSFRRLSVYARLVLLTTFLDLKIIMDASLIQFMQVRQNWFRILCPENNHFTLFERDIHFLLIERIRPNTISFCQPIKEPFRIESRNIGRTAGRKNDGCHLFPRHNVTPDFQMAISRK